MWWDRNQVDDLVLGDAGMWALVPLSLSLVGGFLLFISIFAGEPEGDFIAGVFAVFLGLTVALPMHTRESIVALVLIAVGALGGWVWGAVPRRSFDRRPPISAAGTTDRTTWAT